MKTTRAKRNFLLPTESGSSLGRTQPNIQNVLKLISPDISRPRRGADHSPPSSAGVVLAAFNGVVLNHEVIFTFTSVMERKYTSVMPFMSRPSHVLHGEFQSVLCFFLFSFLI
jgi:hypothetical protein